MKSLNPISSSASKRVCEVRRSTRDPAQKGTNSWYLSTSATTANRSSGECCTVLEDENVFSHRSERLGTSKKRRARGAAHGA